MPQLTREPLRMTGAVAFDPSQEAVLSAPYPRFQVLGAPGTGKTSVAIELVARAHEHGLRPDECVLLSPTRVGAGALRSAVTARVAGTSAEPIARTPQALAFGILRSRASLMGEPAPRLLSGPEQDVVLKELLAGHERGLGSRPNWPDDLALALPTRGFRNELRDLLMRAVEWGLTAEDLASLGDVHARGEWRAAATMLREYEDVTALSSPSAYDPASILGAAAAVLRSDGALLAQYREQLRLIVVDDAQELTKAGADFLSVLVGSQTRCVLLGDPDVTVQGFRGADPQFMGELARSVDMPEPLTLDHGHRLAGELESVRSAVTARIGAVGRVTHRRATGAPEGTGGVRPGDRVRVALLRSEAQEAAHIAGYLRQAHLLENIAWQDMAVIVRSSGGSSALRRALNAAGVPVAVPPSSMALRDEPAVRPFLLALDVITSLTPGDGPVAASAAQADEPSQRDSDGPPTGGDTFDVRPQVDVGVALDLLTSPIGRADPVALRRMRRALRREELAMHGERTSDELLCAALFDPHLATLAGSDAAPARRVGAVLQAGTRVLAQQRDNDAEHVLWAMWQASGLAGPWEEAALRGGVPGTRADRDLDAILALFNAAATFVDRVPGAPARDFLDSVRQQDVPGDRLVAAAPDDDAVALLTPAAAAGREWHTVVVAGVQEGVWPDLRLRGSVLGSSELVDLLAGRGQGLRERTAAVRYDETRQFLVAMTRARGQVLVTAVRDETEQPSQFLDIVDPTGVRNADGLRPFAAVNRPVTLAGVVAESRRMLASSDETLREEAAQRLAQLAAAQVPGADPSQWWALVARSDDRPLRGPDDLVRISPSKVEGFHTCGLRWLLSNNGGFGPAIGASTLGTLIHELAQEFGNLPDSERVQAMRSALDERWPRMGLGQSWISDMQRQKAHDMVTRLDQYFASTTADRWHSLGEERGFSVQVGRAKISGQIDRIEERPGTGVRIIDFKTGGSAVKADEVATNPQLAVYQVALVNDAFGKNVANAGAALVQVGKGGLTGKARVQHQEPLTAASSEAEIPAIEQPGTREWAFDLLERTADGMSAAQFTATTNSYCEMCSVRSSCPIQPEGRTLS